MTLKRVVDVTGAVIGLLTFAPMLLICSVAVKLDSAGPVMFRQTRVGYLGKEFKILKFRTMIWDPADRGAQVTRSGDPRVTRVGRVLRNCKLDELPQLWNVLVGDMSLVGPRPEVPRYVAHYPEHLRSVVFSVRPGITDLASIEYVDENRILSREGDLEAMYVENILPRKLELCRQYVIQQSTWLDACILFKSTLAVVRSLMK